MDAGAATQVNKLLCDVECLAKLDSIEAQETKSGLRYKDIIVGKGPSPPTGYQACSVTPLMTYPADLNACLFGKRLLQSRYQWRLTADVCGR